MLRISLLLQEKKDIRKEEKANKESKEDGSVLTDIETYSRSQSPGESGEASQGGQNFIGGLRAKFSGATATIAEITSSMVLEDMVYEVSHETEGIPFQDDISGLESREWIEMIQSEVRCL